MTGTNRRENIAAELQKSERAWDAAVRNAAAGDYETAANRLYYAAYHAATAVCLSEELEPKTHRGLNSLLKLHFVVPGLLPEGVETTLSRLQTDRDLADYEPGFTHSAQRYGDRQDEAGTLLRQLRDYLIAKGWA